MGGGEINQARLTYISLKKDCAQDERSRNMEASNLTVIQPFMGKNGPNRAKLPIRGFRKKHEPAIGGGSGGP